MKKLIFLVLIGFSVQVFAQELLPTRKEHKPPSEDLRLRPFTPEVLKKLRDTLFRKHRSRYTELEQQKMEGYYDHIRQEWVLLRDPPDFSYIIGAENRWISLSDATEKDLVSYREAYKRLFGEKVPKIEPVRVDNTNPVRVAAQEMRKAHLSMADELEIKDVIKAQRAAIAALEVAIRRHSPNSNSNSQNQSSSRSSAQGGGRAGKGTTAATDSIRTHGRAISYQEEGDRRKVIAKRIWGELRKWKIEQPLWSGPTERFHPKYEFEIEDYFSRLAEEKSK